MSTYEATVNLIRALAWPTATLVVVLIFHRPIKQLLATQTGILKRLRVGPVEAEWDKQLPVVQADALVALSNESKTRLLLRNYYAEEAERNPQHVILEAFCEVEKALREMVDRTWGERRTPGGPEELVREARELGIVDDATVRAIDGIAVLRNLVAYVTAEGVTVQKALDYLALVDAVLYTLDTWASRAKKE